ncbi:MAG TPA: Dyp-type peroxidase [Casimicrobiaceae bacterium]|nr:Dyp-type peroxidase [Casimicrobiaceae bacterium]
MDTLAAQPHILASPPAFARSLTLRLAPQTDPRPCLRKLRDTWSPAWGVVGLGEPLVRALGATVPGLRTFPAFSGAGCAVPSTQQALWLRFGGADPSAIFDCADKALALLAPAFALDDVLDAFLYSGGRDLTGYEDGTENPKGEAAIEAALVGSGEGVKHSSFAAVQKWVHDLARFRSFPAGQRDATIGRRIEDNEEIEDAPASAHVKHTAQESFDPPAFMLRRSMAWTTGREQGLEFVAYGESLDRFERALRRMVGHDDGIVDALFTFSRPVTGGYYWCAPVADGRLDLSLLGI